MDQTPYRMVDNASGGLRRQIEFQSRVNLQMIASRVPFVCAIVVHNETGPAIDAIRPTADLAVVGGDATRCRRQISGPIAPHSFTRLDNSPDFSAFTAIVEGTRHPTRSP